ncbi:DUF2752 domain-containing protein [Niabella beijingensis]|uniref:DUF2752 domain-containing protein n=1 Tax=Niabella beijingensis TaxID=2872700 RepID=UPI001CBAB76D|nr:DUF2752 domain-containing protein [Niabella beijingensis]MBZ4190070.1 DUF2752 domain-containing protein [Niabella beijingensis]
MNGRQFILKYRESITWGAALILLFFMNTESTFSLCPFNALGIWCPGCGIGHSIHHTLHLDLITAWQEHKLGIPATAVLIWQLIKSLPIINKNNNYEPGTSITGYTGY